MFFDRISPSEPLQNLIKEFWIIENQDTTPTVQKIIPDVTARSSSTMVTLTELI